MESSKLLLSSPNNISEILDECIKKIEIVSSIPVNLMEYEDDSVCEAIIDPKTFQPCDEIQTILNVEEMKQNCMEIRKTLTDLKNDLIEKGTFETLINYVEENCDKGLKDLALIEEYQNSKQALDNVRKKSSKLYQEKIKEIDSRLFQQNFDFYQDQYDVEMDKSYAFNFINGQVKQSDLKISEKEERLIKNIRNLDRDIFWEEQSGDDIKLFYETRTAELKEEAARMSAEYDRKMEEVELEFQIVSNEKRRFDEILAKEKLVFEFRQKQMDDYLNMKAKQEAERKLRELQNAQSIKIQAWWRGIMVRKYLGSFKKFKKRARKIRQEMRTAKSQQNKNKKKKK